MTTFTIDTALLRETIFNTLRDLGFCSGRTGYKYATDYLLDNFNCYIAEKPQGAQMQMWYEHIAVKYNTTAKAVDRALRSAIREAVANNRADLTNIFNETALHNGSFMTNRNFMNGVYQYLLANCVLLGFGYPKTQGSEVCDA